MQWAALSAYLGWAALTWSFSLNKIKRGAALTAHVSLNKIKGGTHASETQLKLGM
jgi:hypothetical protein